MNLCTFITLMNYPPDVERFKRHMPFWMAPYTLYEGSIVLGTSVDRPFHHPDFESICVGCAEYQGVEPLSRSLELFRRLKDTHKEADWYFYNETDSFSIKRTIPAKILKTPGIYGPFVKNTDSRYTAPYYVNMPMLISREGLEILCRTFDKLPLNVEMSVLDRWLARLMIEQRIPHNDFGRFGFTRGPIANEMAGELYDAMAKGAQFIHGVKTPEIFNICKS